MSDSEKTKFGGGWIRPAVFGVMDGLVSNIALIAGVAAGATAAGAAQTQTVILAGLAGLGAGAFSMAAGEYVSVVSQRNLLVKHARDSVSSDSIESFVAQQVNPILAAGSSFLAFSIGAIVPLIPYFFGADSVFYSAMITAIALFITGGTVGYITDEHWIRAGARQLLLGTAAGAATHLLGTIAGGVIG
ncbi:MAG: VIT1/CCC1 transporter family protein [Candidatus Nanopelagicales bacterium]